MPNPIRLLVARILMETGGLTLWLGDRARDSISGRLSSQQAISAPLSSKFCGNEFQVRYPDDATQRMRFRGVEKPMTLYLLPVLPIGDKTRLQHRIIGSREH